MLRAPAFWSRDGLLSRALSPLSRIGTAVTARRVARPGWQAPVPVICVGNVTVGGAGKTTVVLDIARRLDGVHVLTRGHGGFATNLLRVSPDDSYVTVGDEALLHARVAPTWRCADRAASARAAIEAGAKVLLMDDGLQNPTLLKTASLLVIDGASGFGNGRVLPAGPLREPVATAAARCGAAVIIGDDATGALRRLPPGLPAFRADLVQDPDIARLAGRKIFAFAGIARPEKFFQPLRDAGAIVEHVRPFPDHYPYMPAETREMLELARSMGAVLVTTPKDAVRLPESFRRHVTVIGVGLRWEQPVLFDAFLQKVIASVPSPVR
jgi:tetraacyldisaccharide 4'-kinase